MDFYDYWWIIIIVIGLPLMALLSNKDEDVESRTVNFNGGSVDMGCIGVFIVTIIIALIVFKCCK